MAPHVVNELKIRGLGANYVPYSSPTGVVLWLAPGTAGKVWTSNGAGTPPSWETVSAGLDAEGAQDAVGAMVDSTLVYVDATPLLTRAALTGDVTASQGSNATTVAADAITYAKMQNVSAASKLVGRGDSGAGDPQEITLGAGLTMTGTTLDAPGGAGYTDEQAQDAVGTILVDSATVDFTYTDATPAITASVIPTGIKLDDLGAPDDNTDLNASITAHGLLKKLSNVSTEYMSGTGVFSTPSGSGIPSTIVDAKGDGIFASAADTVARLPVGTDGQSLLADSTQTLGVRWGGAAGARVHNSANISINNVTETTLTFDSERFDTDAYHSTSSNTSRLTVPAGKAGKYLIGANLEYAADSDGFRLVYIKLNGATVIATIGFRASDGGNLTYCNLSTVYVLAVGDYVEVLTQHSAGNALNIQATGNYSPDFYLLLLGS